MDKALEFLFHEEYLFIKEWRFIRDQKLKRQVKIIWIKKLYVESQFQLNDGFTTKSYLPKEFEKDFDGYKK